MLIAKVVGTAVASVKHEGLHSTKLLLVRPAGPEGQPQGESFLAVDLVGAGENELVVISQGSAARWATGHRDAPVDAAVVGILDSITLESITSYRKE